METSDGVTTTLARWRDRIDVEMIAANAASAAFWSWFAQDTMPLNCVLVPSLYVFGFLASTPRPNRSRLFIWSHALTLGGAFAAVALKLHVMRS